MSKDWLKFEDNLDLFDIEARRNCECLFNDGTICNYDDEFPVAILTHFRLSEQSQKIYRGGKLNEYRK